MITNAIRFFTAIFWNVFTVVVETCRRILFAWARVDRIACWLAVTMMFLAILLGSSFCAWMATAAVACLSLAAWRGERWDLKNDLLIGSRRFQQGWRRPTGSRFPSGLSEAGETPRTTFAASSHRRHEAAGDILQRRLAERIVGQRQAQDLIVSRIASVTLGTRPRTKAPVSFLFVGPTGTGKGEFASLIAEVMGRSVAKFNMGEYNSDQTLWTLLGSPKGYANPEEGLLTRTVRNDPRAVLFFDEIEKGHPRIYDIFLSILDDKDGTFGDLKTGQKIRCGDAIVIFASNLLTDLTVDQAATQNVLRDDLRNGGALRPEFVARIATIVPFYQLTVEELWQITEKQVASYIEDVCDRRRYSAEITVDEDVVRHLVDRQDPKYGARNVRTTIEELVEPALRDALMRIGNRSPNAVHVRRTDGAGLEVAMS